MSQARSRFHLPQVQPGEHVPRGAQRHQTGADRRTGRPVDGIDHPVEYQGAERLMPISGKQRVQHGERRLRQHLRIDRLLVRGGPRYRGDRVGTDRVLIAFRGRYHRRRRQLVLDHELAGLRGVGDLEPLRERGREHRLRAFRGQNQLEVGGHRRRLVRGQARPQPSHIGDIACVLCPHTGDGPLVGRVCVSEAAVRLRYRGGMPVLAEHPAERALLGR